ncbi:MAG: hypothetical protein PWR24_1552 [Desulfonauticus sp.]|nr:hypothetical protein [Desulfonauticus sp.]
MLRLPIFPYYYVNLHSSFILLDEFLSFLKKEEFNGFLEFIFPNKKNFIFLEMGNFYQGVSVNKEINSCTLQDIQNDFVLNVCKLPEDELIYWSNLYYSKIFYENLSTDFTDTVKLINKLKAEGLNGVLNIKYNKNHLNIYFFNGNILGISSNENNRFIRGTSQLSNLIPTINEAVFNVYKIVFNEQTSLASELEQIKKIKKMLTDLFNYLNSIDKKFTLNLKKMCLAGANRYPFIDPFSGEFEYSNGKVYIDDTINRQEVKEGVAFILNSIANNYKFSEQQVRDLQKIIEDNGLKEFNFLK